MISYLLLNNKFAETSATNKTEEQDIPVFEEQEDTPDIEKIIYVLKEYNGKIGVYENDALIYTLDSYVFTLPEIDKQILKKGIVATNISELYELIEEYY